MSENNSLALWERLLPMIDKEINQQTSDRASMKRMVVSTAYDSVNKTVGVREAYGTEVKLPVIGFVDTDALTVGKSVWVLCPYGDLSSALVMMDGNGGSIKDGGGGTVEHPLFIAQYGQTTAQEIADAVSAGKTVALNMGTCDYFWLVYYSGATYYFTQLYSISDGATVYFATLTGNSWSTGANFLQTKLTDYTATLTASGWSNSSPYTQTVSVSGLKSDRRAWIDINMANVTSATYQGLKDAWALVDDASTGNNTLTVKCFKESPTVDIDIIITSM